MLIITSHDTAVQTQMIWQAPPQPSSYMLVQARVRSDVLPYSTRAVVCMLAPESWMHSIMVASATPHDNTAAQHSLDGVGWSFQTHC